MMSTELWKPIKGYEGLYAISNKGHVRSLTNRKCVHGIDTVSEANKELKPTDNGRGYLVIGLFKNKKRKNHYIHRLVAEHFVENPNGYSHVNHLDYDKRNNAASNLEWCTQKQNVRYSRENMCKRRTKATTNTGELYISKQKKDGLYRVTVDRKQMGKYDTLEEAVRVRDEVLNGINSSNE